MIQDPWNYSESQAEAEWELLVKPLLEAADPTDLDEAQDSMETIIKHALVKRTNLAYHKLVTKVKNETIEYLVRERAYSKNDAEDLGRRLEIHLLGENMSEEFKSVLQVLVKGGVLGADELTLNDWITLLTKLPAYLPGSPGSENSLTLEDIMMQEREKENSWRRENNSEKVKDPCKEAVGAVGKAVQVKASDAKGADQPQPQSIGFSNPEEHKHSECLACEGAGGNLCVGNQSDQPQPQPQSILKEPQRKTATQFNSDSTASTQDSNSTVPVEKVEAEHLALE